MADYRHILLALDFSPSTDRVAARARELVADSGAKLSLIHVVDSPAMEYAFAGPVFTDLTLTLQEHAADELKKAAERLDIADAPRFVETGPVKTEIHRIAKEHDVDLIVIGSHGVNGLKLLLGSTANAVLHGAPCDVLAVRVSS